MDMDALTALVNSPGNNLFVQRLLPDGAVVQDRDGSFLPHPESVSVRVLTDKFEQQGLYAYDGMQVLIDGVPVPFTLKGNNVVLEKPVHGMGRIETRYYRHADEKAWPDSDSSLLSVPVKIGGVKASKQKRKAAKAARKKNRK